MSVPDLETVKFKVLRREEEYEIREVEVRFFFWYVWQLQLSSVDGKIIMKSHVGDRNLHHQY